MTLYRPPSSHLVEALKYQGWRSLVPFLGGRLAALVTRDPGIPRPTLVTPIPSPPRRRRRRGFNPAELLAREVAGRLNLPVRDLLLRPREGPRQVGLPASQRAANVQNAFTPAGVHPGPRPGSSILLVDDVLTTGATGAAAAEVLERLGAGDVTLVTFARALPELPGSP